MEAESPATRGAKKELAGYDSEYSFMSRETSRLAELIGRQMTEQATEPVMTDEASVPVSTGSQLHLTGHWTGQILTYGHQQQSV